MHVSAGGKVTGTRQKYIKTKGSKAENSNPIKINTSNTHQADSSHSLTLHRKRTPKTKIGY